MIERVAGVDKRAARQHLTGMLYREGANNNTWLWCIHCYRLQQGRHLRAVLEVFNLCGKEFRGEALYCHFEDCDGAGIGVDLWPCDDGQHEGFFPPVSERELGLKREY